MGIEQILRISRIDRLTLGFVALGMVIATIIATIIAMSAANVHAQQRRAAPTVPDEPVAIIDTRNTRSDTRDTRSTTEGTSQESASQVTPDNAARSESRRAFASALARFRGVKLFPGPGQAAALAAALAGEARAPADPSSRNPAFSSPGPLSDPIAPIKAAYDKNDCAAATQASERAIEVLAARQAAGNKDTDDLQRAYGYALLCAHGQSNSDLAIRARSQLERLGVTRAPPGVSDLVWNLYPALDATANSELIELTIVTIPPGGVIWLDHQKLGNSPIVAVASEGPHLVAVTMADGSRSTARQLAVARREGYDGDKQTLTLPVAEPGPAAPGPGADTPASTAAVARLVERWRSGAPVNGQDLGRLMTGLTIRVAVVLSGAPTGDNGKAEIWALGPGETVARQIGTYTMDEARSIANTIVKRVRRWELTGPTAGVEILRESPEERRSQGHGRIDPASDSARSKGPKWWVYATIIGAATAGATFILFDDLSSDRQRIELELP